VPRQTGEHPAVDDSSRLVGQREKGHEDVRARQELRELAFARESLESVDRDEGRTPVDDFLENGSDDLGTARRVATVYFHKASLRSRGW